ncbi:gamma-glutamyltransferase [soil metagenome]
MRRCLVAGVALLSLFAGASPAIATEGSRFRPPVRSDEGVVATESRQAARVGVHVLREGGNAIDAAVATVFAIGVARPQSCGIGGGGFLVYRGADGTRATLDFRETAPAAFTPTVFQGSGIFEDFSGHRTIGVPGVVDGMWEALERFGTIDWADAIRPAEHLARRGITVTRSLSADMASQQERLELFPEAADIYLKNGRRPYPVGSKLVQKDYARSLELIRKQGPRAFYEGRIARLIIRDMRRSGDLPGDRGLMRLRDLAGYDSKWRAPLTGTYRGHKVIAMPPPTSGGVATLEMLNILEGFDVASFGHSSADHFHFLSEAQKIAWADRNEYVADPDFVNVPTRALTSKSYAAKRRREISGERAKKYEPGNFGNAVSASTDAQGGTTTHLSFIDQWGNAVAVTCTIEQSFGSGVVAPGTGFLLNNEMTDFGDPGTANEPEGGKRPRSSMSPTIVAHEGEPVLVTGGAGGPLIIMGVLHAIVNYVDFDMDIAHAVDAERSDAQLAVTEPGFPLLLEDGRVPAAVENELESRGHELVTLEGIYEPEDEYAVLPRIQAAGVDPASGQRLGVSDPRAENGTLGQ